MSPLLTHSRTTRYKIVSCTVQFQHRQAFVSSASKFQVQLSTFNGSGALPQPFRISFVQVEFSDPSLNHRFEDLRPYSQTEEKYETQSLEDAKAISMKDRTGRTIEWNDCSKCELDATGSNPDSESAEGGSRSQSIWKSGVQLDIRPFETKVLEGVIIPKKEQIVKVTIYDRADGCYDRLLDLAIDFLEFLAGYESGSRDCNGALECGA